MSFPSKVYTKGLQKHLRKGNEVSGMYFLLMIMVFEGTLKLTVPFQH